MSRSNDNVAIATYTVDQKVEYDGKAMQMQALDSFHLIREGADWKCVAHTESLQPPRE